jgi:hypothetical protein
MAVPKHRAYRETTRTAKLRIGRRIERSIGVTKVKRVDDRVALADGSRFPVERVRLEVWRRLTYVTRR